MTEPPAIEPLYLSTDLDRRTTVAAIKLARRLAETQAARPYVAEEIRPGPGVVTDAEGPGIRPRCGGDHLPPLPGPAAWGATRMRSSIRA